MHDRDEQISDPDATVAVLSGLLPNTKYRVHIYAMTALGRGEGTFIEVETTMKAGNQIVYACSVMSVYLSGHLSVCFCITAFYWVGGTSIGISPLPP